MRGGRLVAAALVVLVGAGACSSKDHKGTSETSASTTSSMPAAEVARLNAAAPVDPATGKQPVVRQGETYSAVSPPPTDFRAADGSGDKGVVPLSAKVTPACVEHGQTVHIVLKSEPGMLIVAQIKWPNDQFSGLDSTRGKAGKDGTWTWDVEVKPTALFGEATVQAAAIDEEDGSRSGTSGDWRFVVATPGHC
jgi:hypothetical protein